MSTKIHYGFRFVDGTSLWDAYSVLRRIQVELKRKVDDDLRKWLVEESVKELDKRTLGLPSDRKCPPLYALSEEFLERTYKIQRERRRDPEVDYEFQVTILPLPNGKILGIPFCEQEWMRAFLMEQPEVQPYGYWNNTDKDDDCTDEEWEERKEDWDEAFRITDVPAEAGLNIDLIGADYALPYTLDLKKHMPAIDIAPLEKRASKMALRILMDERFTAFQTGKPADEKEKSVWVDLMEAGDWCQSKEGKDAIDALAQEIEPKLVAPVTYDVLISLPKPKEAVDAGQ